MNEARAHELLAAERSRIEHALARLEREDDGEQSDPFFDTANRATELYEEELDEGLADDLHEQLAAVGRTEQRLAAGTFGISFDSGKQIPDERLEVLPTAERTAEEERARSER